MIKLRALLLFCFISCLAYSQFPGGISANLRGWYDGSSGVGLSGGLVNQWNDRSGNVFHGTQTVAASRPDDNALMNYNLALTFDGTNDYLNIPDLVASGATGLTAFVVARQTATSGDPFGCLLVGQTNNVGASGGYGITTYLPGSNTTFGFFVRDFTVNTVNYATTLPEPAILTGNWNGTTANNVQMFENGTSRGTDPFTPGTVGDNGSSYIGSGIGAGTDYCFFGNIAEIAVYNAGLNATNTNRVESYLGLKYGITLSTNYNNSSGTNVFTTAAPYNLDIIGVGRDDGSGLIQKQSRNFDDSVRIYISSLAATNAANVGSFSGNNQYVIMGANNGSLRGITTEKPGSVFSRIQREWKVTNTGFSSTWSFEIKLPAAAAPGSVNPAHLRLLIDNDGNFADATVVNAGLTFAYNNPVITVGGITTAMIAAGSTSYITIASNTSGTPLPIELLGFEVTPCDYYACIKWQTAVEKKNRMFEVERSKDAVEWQSIGSRPGYGNSSEIKEYFLIDSISEPDLYYYRLKQLDFDGTVSYSSIKYFDSRNNNHQHEIFPSPADKFIILNNYQNVPRIFDSYGKEMTSTVNVLSFVGENIVLDVSNLPPGMYLVSGSNPHSFTETKKILIQH